MNALVVRDLMTHETAQIEAAEPISKALELILSSGARHLAVTEDGKLAGVLGERDILRYQAEHGAGALGDPVRKAASMPAQFASPEDSVTEAEARMTQRKVGCLPVLEQGRVVGILTVQGVLARHVDRVMRGPKPTSAREIMSRHPIGVRPSDSLAVGAERMAANRVRHLPVVDDEGRICGILSDRDLRAVSAKSTLDERQVLEVMTKSVISLPPSASLPELVDAFIGRNLTAVPITDEEGRPVGMVSYVDLLRALSG